MLKSAQPGKKPHVHGFFQKEKQAIKNTRQTPCANVEDRKEEYVITLAAPGFHRHHLDISILGNKVCIKAKKDCTVSGDLPKKVQSEYDFNEWQRTFFLPANADALFAHAFYLHGELELHIPKSDRPIAHSSLKVDIY